MMNKIAKLFCFLVTICIFSCKADLFEKMSETTVTGSIKDGNFHTPIQGAKVYVWQYGKSGDLVKSQTFPEKIIDSAITNHLGKYTINFESSNRAHAYKAHFSLSKEFIYSYPSQEIQKGNNNIFDFAAYKTCVLKATIACSADQAYPLNIYTRSEINPDEPLFAFKLNEVKSDTTLMLKLIPNKNNSVVFTVYDGKSSFTYSETIRPNASLDTIVRRYDLDPKFFKR